MNYGFQKLGLLNSGGYQRAEMPLDAAVSLIAPNNTGKTTLINALQFLLIIDKRHMDFGAHDLESSRRFYFPDNGAYILLEVSLPGGTAVLGCVGKGLAMNTNTLHIWGSLTSTIIGQTTGKQSATRSWCSIWRNDKSARSSSAKMISPVPFTGSARDFPESPISVFSV